MYDRRKQLEELHANLCKIIEVLAHDPCCQWRKHYEICEAETRALLNNGFSQAELNLLSGSVNSICGGAGSFTDYAPIKVTADGSWKVIAGMEKLDEIGGKVYESALALRVIGHR